MSKEEFIAAVRARLAGLPQEDVERSVEYYGEMIDDRIESGMTEAEAVAALGSAEEAASKIAAGLPSAPRYRVPVMPAAPTVETTAQRSEDHTPSRRVPAWRIILPVAVAAAVVLSAIGWLSASGVGVGTHTTAYDVAEAFSDVDISVVESDVIIAPSKNGSCRVVCRDLERVESAVEVKNGALTISRRDRRPWYARIGLWWIGDMSVTVYLPEREYGALRLKTVSGDISAAAESGFADAEIASTSGGISFYGRADGMVSVKSVSGDVWIEDTAADSVTVTTTSGDIRLSEVDAGALTVTTTSGDASCEVVLVSGAAQFEVVSGDVWFYDSDAGSLRVKTVSGEVGASLLSPKNFSVSTTSGDVRVPPSDETAGECIVKTTSGDVDIHFAPTLG